MSWLARPKNVLPADNACHVASSFVWTSIVLLHLPLVSPMTSLLEQSVTLWNEMVTQHIILLLMSYTSVRALSLGVDVLADLLVCTNHKLEAAYTMVRYAHVHMSSITPFGSGNNSPCSGCTPSASRFAHCMHSEDLLSEVRTQRHEQRSLLRANSANLTLAYFCLGFSIGTSCAVRCCSPLFLRRRLTLRVLNFRPVAC